MSVKISLKKTGILTLVKTICYFTRIVMSSFGIIFKSTPEHCVHVESNLKYRNQHGSPRAQTK